MDSSLTRPSMPKCYRWDCTYTGFLQPATEAAVELVGWSFIDICPSLLFTVIAPSWAPVPPMCEVFLRPRGAPVLSRCAEALKNNIKNQHNEIIGYKFNKLFRLRFPISHSDMLYVFPRDGARKTVPQTNTFHHKLHLPELLESHRSDWPVATCAREKCSLCSCRAMLLALRQTTEAHQKKSQGKRKWISCIFLCVCVNS